jgi:Reverse transcriptase (RNA-dependent DNA polymerase)
MLLAAGTLPRSLKESTIIALRKEEKKDYSLLSSYRLIALENSLAKVVEKVLANRLSDAVEKHALLSWAQMGARKERSTLSAIGLLTSCVQTAWRAKPGCVVSMLSLDLAGAFDNVPPERLTEIL